MTRTTVAPALLTSLLLSLILSERSARSGAPRLTASLTSLIRVLLLSDPHIKSGITMIWAEHVALQCACDVSRLLLGTRSSRS